MRRKKVERKEKGTRYDHLVVELDDVRRAKYPVPLGREPYGVTLEHARALAAPVPGQKVYEPVEIEVWQYVQGSVAPVSVEEARGLYRAYQETEKEEEE